MDRPKSVSPADSDLFRRRSDPHCCRAKPFTRKFTSVEFAKTLLLIWVVGDLDQTAQLKFSTTHTTKDYLSQIDNLWLRGRDTVTLIQPNGEIQSVNIAYWNENHTRLLPGTTIYVPFLNLSSEFEQLNTEIPRLLQHRILTS